MICVVENFSESCWYLNHSHTHTVSSGINFRSMLNAWNMHMYLHRLKLVIDS